MRSERKDLPAARSKSEADLKAEFTFEELMQERWGEIDAKRKVFPDRQEEDIDRMQWADRYHISITAAITQMKQFVKENEGWEIVKVRSGTGRFINVMRK